MRKFWLLAFVAFLVACPSDNASPPSVDAKAPPPAETTFNRFAPAPPYTPTPMPAWLTSPRPPLGNVRAAGTRPPIIPASWTVAAWFIDPANSSGVASDNNTCTTSGAPCLTYAEIAARWGTYSPRLRQTTTVTFTSSQTTTADPVYWAPYLENGGSAILTSTLTQVTAGTLGGVVAKNRNTPQLLNATFTGGAEAVNELVINSTRANSRAWTYKSLGAGAFSMSQPMAPLTPPTAIGATENNAWANTDAFTVNTVQAVDVVAFTPTIADVNSNTRAYLFQLKVFDPGASGNFLTLNGNVALIDVLSSRTVVIPSDASPGVVSSYFYNVDMQGGLTKSTAGPAWLNEAGIITGGGASGTSVTAMAFDADVILNTNAEIYSNTFGGSSSVSLFYIETARTLTFASGTNFANNQGISTPIIWGPGNLAVVGAAHLFNSNGGGFAATLKFTGTIRLNGSATACSHTGAAPDVINCGITINATNLDAAAGVAGFGSNAFIPGGGSISNF